MDLWNRRRLFRLENSDEPLPFGEPPLVLGRVIVTWEPVWRAAVATALSDGVSDRFTGWGWDTPLAPEAAADLASDLVPVVANLRRDGRVVVPTVLEDADPPDAAMVGQVLELVRRLFVVAAGGHHRVETWVD